MSDETKFEIGNKAELLYYSVFDLTTNRQHYPVKFRRLADKLQEYALDIHSDVLDANAYPTAIKPASTQFRLYIARFDIGKFTDFPIGAVRFRQRGARLWHDSQRGTRPADAEIARCANEKVSSQGLWKQSLFF